MRRLFTTFAICLALIVGKAHAQESIVPNELHAPGFVRQLNDCPFNLGNRFGWGPSCGGSTGATDCHTHPCVNKLCFDPPGCAAGSVINDLNQFGHPQTCLTGAGITAPPADKDVIINDGGVFGTDTGVFTYDKVNNRLEIDDGGVMRWQNIGGAITESYQSDVGGGIILQYTSDTGSGSPGSSYLYAHSQPGFLLSEPGDVVMQQEYAGSDTNDFTFVGARYRVIVAASPSPSYVPMDMEFAVGGSTSTLQNVLKLLGLTYDVALPQKPGCSVLGTQAVSGIIECKPTITPTPTPTATPTPTLTGVTATPTPTATSTPSGCPAGASGEVQFNGGVGCDADPELHWDTTNKRLRVGFTTAADATLDVERTTTDNNKVAEFTGTVTAGTGADITMERHTYEFSTGLVSLGMNTAIIEYLPTFRNTVTTIGIVGTVSGVSYDFQLTNDLGSVVMPDASVVKFNGAFTKDSLFTGDTINLLDLSYTQVAGTIDTFNGVRIRTPSFAAGNPILALNAINIEPLGGGRGIFQQSLSDINILAGKTVMGSVSVPAVNHAHASAGALGFGNANAVAGASGTVLPYSVWLFNRTGGASVANRIAVVDTANVDSYIYSSAVGQCTVIGVDQLTAIANNSASRVAIDGIVTILAAGSAVTTGDFLQTSATAGQAQSAGATCTINECCFARALNSKAAGAGSVRAELLLGLQMTNPTATPTPTTTPTPTITSTPTATVTPTPTITATPPADYFTVATEGTSTFATTVAFSPLFTGGLGPVTTEAQRQDVAPVNLECDELRVCGSVVLAATETVVVTVRDDGVDTALSCTVNGASVTATCTDVSTQKGCRDTEAVPVQIAQNSLTTVSFDCVGAGCPTASTSLYVTLRCRRF